MVPPEQDSLTTARHSGPGRTSGLTARSRFVRLSRLSAIAFAVIAALTTACDKKHKPETTSSNFDPEVTPTMVTCPVTTLISDSGITRYRITAPVWLVFDEAAEPRWNFPEGMNMEKFDNLFRQEATVRCDSAVYLTRKQLWQLDGYVHIQNVAGEQFLTQQLFWDQKARKIYSDSFIHILRADRVIEGYGFESDEQMAHYKVRQVQGIFPVSQFRNEDDGSAPAPTSPAPPGGIAAPADSAATDSAATETLPPPLPKRKPVRPQRTRVLKPAGVPFRTADPSQN